MDSERSVRPAPCEIEPPYPFGSMYADFAEKCRTSPDGYDFHDPAVLRNVPPPTATVTAAPWWRHLSRRRRLAVGLKLRDALVRGILALNRRHGFLPGRPAPDGPVSLPPEVSIP